MPLQPLAHIGYFSPQKTAVTSLAVATKGTVAVTADESRYLRHWDLRNPSEEPSHVAADRIVHPAVLTYIPDSREALVVLSEIFADQALQASAVQVFTGSLGSLEGGMDRSHRFLSGIKGLARSIGAGPATNLFTVGTSEGSIHTYDPLGRPPEQFLSPLHSIEMQEGPVVYVAGSSTSYTGLVFASADEAGKISVRNIKGELIERHQADGKVASLQFGWNNVLVALTSSGKIMVPQASFDKVDSWGFGHSCVAVSRTEPVLYAARRDEDSVYVYSLSSGQVLRAVSTKHCPTALCLSTDEKLLVAGLEDGGIQTTGVEVSTAMGNERHVYLATTSGQ